MKKLQAAHDPVFLNDAKPLTSSLIEREPKYYNPYSKSVDGYGPDESTKLLPRDGIVNEPKVQSAIFMHDQMLYFY
jgi:hypothetical protein